MSFVPFVPVVTPPPPPSPEAQELGRRLAETIESFKREHPDMRGCEIQQAMRLALAGRGEVGPAAAVVLMGLFVALGVGGFLLLNSRPGGEVAVPVVVLVFLALIVGIVVFRIKNR